MKDKKESRNLDLEVIRDGDRCSSHANDENFDQHDSPKPGKQLHRSNPYYGICV